MSEEIDSARTSLPMLPPPSFQTLRIILALVLREMGSTYGRSPGGYIWALMKPIGNLAMMSIAFSFLVHSPALGKSFILFYATGYLPFSMFSTLCIKVGSALKYSKALLAYPKVLWIDTIAARFILNFLTEAVVFCIVIIGIFIIADVHTSIDIIPIMAGLSIMAALGLSVGMANCLLTSYFPIWARIWEILSRPLIIASGIFFLPDDLPLNLREALWYNPLVHGIVLVREGFYPTYRSDLDSALYPTLLTMLLIPLTLVFLRRGHLSSMEN